jgi:hypothetical protein
MNMKYISFEDYPKISLNFYASLSIKPSVCSSFSDATFSSSSGTSSARDSHFTNPREFSGRLGVGVLEPFIEGYSVDHEDIEESVITFSKVDWNPPISHTREYLRSVPPDLVLTFPSKPNVEIKETVAVGEQRVMRSMVRKRKSQDVHERRKTRAWTSWNEHQKEGLSKRSSDSTYAYG